MVPRPGESKPAAMAAMSRPAMTVHAAATAARGWVRRHSSATIGTSWTATANGRQGMSSLVRPSAMARATRTPTSTQSRHVRRGGLGSRGSAQNDRRALISTIDSVLAGPAPVVRRKYDERIDRGLT